MAEPSGEAVEASASPSSPRHPFNYAFGLDDYYTDDQSDDCYGGDSGGTKARSSGKIEPESDDESDSDDEDHERHCKLHADPLATHCNALTRTQKKCSRKAKIFNEECFPVCSIHQFWIQKGAGKCQAVEECGRVCNRYAPRAPPWHLCAKHEKGNNTLPCGIMSLPTELHLMIFRYLFPDVVPYSGLPPNAGAVLRVNQAFYQAASFILYDELEYKADIRLASIHFLGRAWRTDVSNHKYSTINKALCQPGAQRIRKLQVEVHLGDSTRIKGIGTHDITSEDYHLYQLRDAVRKFVEMLWPKPKLVSSTPTLKQVEVQPTPQVESMWSTEEAVAAIFFVLEPFVALGPIEMPRLLPCRRSKPWHHRFQPVANVIDNLHKHETYRRLSEGWLASMKEKLSTPNHVQREGKRERLITREYQKIERFRSLIHKHEMANAKQDWVSTSFQGIERVLHIARIVEMNLNNDPKEDLERMQQISEIITKRWVKAHRQQQRTVSTIASCINNMSHANLEDPIDAYPDAFKFELLGNIEQDTTVDRLWSELGKPDAAPRLGAAGVTYTEDDFRVYIHGEGKTYVRLKTPSLVRQLQAVKRT